MDHPRLERLLEALHRTDDATTVLRRLCLVCVDQIGIDGATLSAFDNGHSRVLDASDDRAAAVAAIQWELGDGPCLEALATFQPSAGSDLTSPEAHDRWPRFAPAATERGIVAAFAFPLLHGGIATGTLDLYDQTITHLDTDQNADALMVAELANLAIDQRHASLGIDEVGISVEPTAAWAHPAIVHNATGMLSAQLSISVDDALLRLRALAFVRNAPSPSSHATSSHVNSRSNPGSKMHDNQHRLDRESELIDALVHLADTLVADYDIIDCRVCLDFSGIC